MFPNIPIPPQPVVTRWGTWIEAAIYFAIHFEEIKAFLNELDSDEAECINNAKAIISIPTMKKELAFIKSNFECLVSSITKLQGQGIPLAKALEIFESVRTKLQSIRGRPEFLNKFDRVIARNNGFLKIKEIASILDTGNATKPDEYIDELSPVEMSSFMYAPITSCDVERTFSKYKQVLGDQRRSFLFDNLKMHVVIYCNRFESP